MTLQDRFFAKWNLFVQQMEQLTDPSPVFSPLRSWHLASLSPTPPVAYALHGTFIDAVAICILVVHVHLNPIHVHTIFPPNFYIWLRLEGLSVLLGCLFSRVQGAFKLDVCSWLVGGGGGGKPKNFCRIIFLLVLIINQHQKLHWTPFWNFRFFHRVALKCPITSILQNPRWRP